MGNEETYVITQVTKENVQAAENVCDMALKSNGLQALPYVDSLREMLKHLHQNPARPEAPAENE